MTRPATGSTGMTRPATGSTGMTRLATGSTGMTRPATGSTGMTRSATGSTGMTRPATGSTGMTRPATGSMAKAGIEPRYAEVKADALPLGQRGGLYLFALKAILFWDGRGGVGCGGGGGYREEPEESKRIETALLGLLVGCLTPQQQAGVSQGRICSDKFTCCHTETEVADQTFYLTQSQYTDTGPTSPSADPITPGAWQGGHWSTKF